MTPKFNKCVHYRERERELTIVSPIPRLKIPAKGARGRSLYPEDIQIGRAHPSKSEKWLGKSKIVMKEN
jgi:hypothetical protein